MCWCCLHMLLVSVPVLLKSCPLHACTVCACALTLFLCCLTAARAGTLLACVLVSSSCVAQELLTARCPADCRTRPPARAVAWWCCAAMPMLHRPLLAWTAISGRACTLPWW